MKVLSKTTSSVRNYVGDAERRIIGIVTSDIRAPEKVSGFCRKGDLPEKGLETTACPGR